MEEFDQTTETINQEGTVREERRRRLREYVVRLFKRFIVLVSFGPGVLGLLWLIGKIFKL